jgi:hypothetical protein
MEPPQINRHKMPRSRLTNNTRKKINEYGIEIPSKNVENYKPSLEKTAMLFSSGILPGSTRVRYNVNAKARRNNAWEAYLRKWTNAKARETKKNKNRARNNNGTRRTLF